MQNKVTIKIYK